MRPVKARARFGGCRRSRLGDARVLVDDRRDYGEVRYRAVGLYKDQPHFVAFTIRGEKIRVISFRKASAREARLYGKQK